MLKDFYGQRQITDLFMIDASQVVVSDKVSCNNGKDCCYIVGYQVDRELIPLFIKTPLFMKTSFNADTMSFNVSEAKGGCLNIKRFGMRLSHNYLKNW